MSNTKKHGERVATVHVNFNISTSKEPNAGPSTQAERVEAVERFIRWHERQVAVGKELLTQIVASDDTKSIDGVQAPEAVEPVTV